MILQRKAAITENSSILTNEEETNKEEVTKKVEKSSDNINSIESGAENV